MERQQLHMISSPSKTPAQEDQLGYIMDMRGNTQRRRLLRITFLRRPQGSVTAALPGDKIWLGSRELQQLRCGHMLQQATEAYVMSLKFTSLIGTTHGPHHSSEPT